MEAGRARRTPSASRHVGFLALAVAFLAAAPLSAETEGRPLTRFYPFEEIGNVSPGLQLGFDPLGRITVTQTGTYAALNDRAWTNLVDPGSSDIQILQVEHDAAGKAYFGALGSWGILRRTASGTLRPEALAPANPPGWALSTSFTEILCVDEGVYFAGQEGVVFYEPDSGKQRFIRVPGVATLFAVDGRAYVSSHSKGVHQLDGPRASTIDSSSAFGDAVIRTLTEIGNDRAIAATTGRRLLQYDRHHGFVTPFAAELWDTTPGSVSGLEALPEGDVAISISGVGLYILGSDGSPKLAFTTPEFRWISGLACNEPGVLWAATEDGVIKILYGHPITVIGQAVGVPIRWPQVVAWNDQVIIASGGRLYQRSSGTTPGSPTQFEIMPDQPAAGAWGIAVAGPWLLAGNSSVFARLPGEPFKQVLPDQDAARLATLDERTCLVIGSNHIAALRRDDAGWSEFTPRIPAAGYPFVVHAGVRSVWIELGVGRVARVSLSQGKLEKQVFESFDRKPAQWINVSVVDNVAILSGGGTLQYFDENTQAFVENPAIAEVLARSPFPVQRVTRDHAGAYWISHEHGLTTVTPAEAGYAVDSTTYAAIDNRTPLVQPLADGSIWASTGNFLYHLDHTRAKVTSPPLQPVLVSVRDNRTYSELDYGGRPQTPAMRPLEYGENSITFDVFSGSYASRRPLAYEFSLNDGPWTGVAGSSVVLSDLHEGPYDLRVRLVDRHGPVGTPSEYSFSIQPPWYRTWYAMGSYPLVAVLCLAAVVRISLRRAKARHSVLERMVTERTHELAATMDKLEQETRTSATLAERNRLAGEIHDSVEQAFTGLKLQLETTASLTDCPPGVKSGMDVALNMIAFGRSEVRHAVRNLHSPALDSGDLAHALNQIIAQTAPTSNRAALSIRGTPRQIASTVEHHLLRIAQEAITNALKHAQAERVEVTLTFSDTEVQLVVSDDGIGFEPARVLDRGLRHFGLTTFRGRASKIGGRVEITSRPGAGTRIAVRAPINATV